MLILYIYIYIYVYIYTCTYIRKVHRHTYSYVRINKNTCVLTFCRAPTSQLRTACSGRTRSTWGSSARLCSVCPRATTSSPWPPMSRTQAIHRISPMSFDGLEHLYTYLYIYIHTYVRTCICSASLAFDL